MTGEDCDEPVLALLCGSAKVYRLLTDPGILLDALNQPLVERAVQAFFPESEEHVVALIVDSRSHHSDALFQEAQSQVLRGTDVRATRLEQALALLLPCTHQLVFWDGDDWMNLPVVSRDEDLFVSLTFQLTDSAGEVYLLYCRNSDHGA